MSNAELATSYAALILADEGLDITVRVTELWPVKILLSLPARQTQHLNQNRWCLGR